MQPDLQQQQPQLYENLTNILNDEEKKIIESVFHEADAKALRRRHAGTVFLAGLVIAAFLAVPLLNLLTPLFAAAMMVHLHKMVSKTVEHAPAAA